jgi:hypothetical protein
MPNNQQSETPESDAHSIKFHTHPIHTLQKVVAERDSCKAKAKELEENLRVITTDKNYIGGTQYWIKKHDELAIACAKSLAKASALDWLEKNATKIEFAILEPMLLWREGDLLPKINQAQKEQG